MTKILNALKGLSLMALLLLSIATTTAQTIEHVRNATTRIEFAGKTFLVDPMLAPKGHYPGFEGTARAHLRNPLVELPYSTERVLRGVDAVLITHTHLDHWDDFAQQLIDKELPILVQNAQDATLVRSQGFKRVYVIGVDALPFEGIELHSVKGQHGTDQMYALAPLAQQLGETIGIVFSAEGQKSIFLVGDTIWTPEVSSAIKRYAPNIIVLNTGNALIDGFEDSIIMGTADVARAAQEAPNAKIIAVHMEAVNHCVLSRRELKSFVKKHKLSKQVIVPKDGERLKF